MTNIEQTIWRETGLDRDAYVHRSELLGIARTVALEERSDLPASEFVPREYLNLFIDLAELNGYSMDNLEAIDLLEHARSKIYAESMPESPVISEGAYSTSDTQQDEDQLLITGEHND